MINISISHRSIKIGAIFIAGLILAVMAIPAGSQQTLREGVTLELPSANPEIPTAPFEGLVEGATVKMTISDVVQVGIYEIGETRHGWAFVYLRNDDPLDFSVNSRVLYVPGARMQSLFETALTKEGVLITVYAHPIEKPEGWTGTEDSTLYKVTSAFLTYWPGSG